MQMKRWNLAISDDTQRRPPMVTSTQASGGFCNRANFDLDESHTIPERFEKATKRLAKKGH